MRDQRAQTMMEYAVLTACIVAALISMQHYLSRSIQGRVKQTADQIGEPYDADKISADAYSRMTVDMTSKAKLVSTGVQDAYGNNVLGYETSVHQGILSNKSEHDVFSADSAQ